MARARTTEAKRLTARGIVFVEVDGVLAKFTRKTSDIARDDADFKSRMLDQATTLARLVGVIRQRAFAWRFRGLPYGGREGGYRVDAEYAEKIGSAVPVWAWNSARWHAASGRPPTAITGGMWSGLFVTQRGEKSIATWRKQSMGTKGAMVLNRAKANALLSRHGLNVLLPAATEVSATESAIMASLAVAAGYAFDVREPGGRSGAMVIDPILFAALSQAGRAAPVPVGG